MAYSVPAPPDRRRTPAPRVPAPRVRHPTDLLPADFLPADFPPSTVRPNRSLQPDPARGGRHRAPPSAATHSRSHRILLVTGLVAVAVNLRSAITSLGAVLHEVTRAWGMSGLLAGVLTALPVATFAVVGALTPAVARRLGPERAVSLAMLVAAIGLVLRALAGSVTLFLAATGCALAGAAVGNVLMPGLVKRHFAERTGPATALYTTALALGMTGGAALTGPAEHLFHGDWRIGLGVWAALALAAAPPWLLVTRLAPARPAPVTASPPTASRPTAYRPIAPPPARRAPVGGGRDAVSMTHPGRRGTALAGAGRASATLGVRRVAARAPAAPAVPAPTGPTERTPLHRNGLARALTLFFGCQSLNAYVVLGWLPSILTDAGWDPRAASLPLALFSAMSIPMSIVLPAVAGRRPDQRGLVALTTACYALGYLGLLAAQVMPGALGVLGWLSAGLLGAGNGAFPLAVTLIGLRSRRAEMTTTLSALVQSGGYLLAVVGPLLVGLLHQVCGGWRVPLLLVLVTLAPQLLSGWRSARPGTVEGGPEPATARPAPGRHRSSRLGRPAAPPIVPATRPVRAAQPAWSPSAGRRGSGPIR